MARRSNGKPVRPPEGAVEFHHQTPGLYLSYLRRMGEDRFGDIEGVVVGAFAAQERRRPMEARSLQILIHPSDATRDAVEEWLDACGFQVRRHETVGALGELSRYRQLRRDLLIDIIDLPGMWRNVWPSANRRFGTTSLYVASLSSIADIDARLPEQYQAPGLSEALTHSRGIEQ